MNPNQIIAALIDVARRAHYAAYAATTITNDPANVFISKCDFDGLVKAIHALDAIPQRENETLTGPARAERAMASFLEAVRPMGVPSDEQEGIDLMQPRKTVGAPAIAFPTATQREDMNKMLLHVKDVVSAQAAKEIINSTGVKRMSDIPASAFLDVILRCKKVIAKHEVAATETTLKTPVQSSAHEADQRTKRAALLMPLMAEAFEAGIKALDEAFDGRPDRVPNEEISEDLALVMEAFDFGQFSQGMLNDPNRGMAEPVRAALCRLLQKRYDELYGPATPTPPLSKDTYQANTIYVLATDDTGKLVTRGARSTSAPAIDCHIMESALELEQSVRLRGNSFDPHNLGSIWILSESPLPYQIREIGKDDEWCDVNARAYHHAKNNPIMDTRFNPATLKDWMRVMVFDDMMMRLALPGNDESSVGAYDVLDELNRVAHEANVMDKMKWIGKPKGDRPEFSIEDLLSLADGLDCMPRTETIGVNNLESVAACAARFIRSWLTTGIVLADRSSDFETQGRLTLQPGADMPIPLSEPVTCDDALRALIRQTLGTTGNTDLWIVRQFLERIVERSERMSDIKTDDEGYIVEGAHNCGFDTIDDNGDLMIVHTNDLIKYVKAHREYALDNKLVYPETLTPTLEYILGTMCFQISVYVQQYRENGAVIKTKAEAEQAFMLDRMLRMLMTHGEDGWVAAVNADMNKQQVPQ